ncbi:MAG: ROK family transcriptional regulator [Trueperaceae bacterium]|nr:ROK family transcriptional regulator [Trueperaceae bacterium]MCC6310775.1 ROK family transcriptional regulator [Trueperaceae bacterium]MCW5820428.1 ROK family transcriptional regulator [Trueperaceae bacterium]
MAISEIFSTIRSRGPLSRAELSRVTGLSKPTVSSVVRELIEARLVLEHGQAASEGGRPPTLVGFNGNAGYVMGVDVGGTTTRAVLTDLEGSVLASRREPTRGETTAALVDQLVRLADRLAGEARVDRAGMVTAVIGTPGVVDPDTGVVRYVPNLPVLEDPTFLRSLRTRLCPTATVFNDVNLAALGEHWRGAGRDLETFAFISIGTGLGVGLVTDGRLQTGSHGRAGELGYLRLGPTDPSSVEEVLSGPGIARAHRLAGGSGDPHDAFDEAEAGREPGAVVVSSLLSVLAWLCSAVAMTLDPEVIVLGGGIGMRLEHHLPTVRRLLGDASPMTPPIVVSQLGDDAGLFGAIASGLSASNHLILDRIGGSDQPIASSQR